MWNGLRCDRPKTLNIISFLVNNCIEPYVERLARDYEAGVPLPR
jgi:hypothetical protein